MMNPMRRTETFTSGAVDRPSGRAMPPSGHLEDDAFDHVDHVLAAVGDRFHRLVQLLPLDQLDGVYSALEQRGELVPQEAVRLVLEAIHLDAVLVIEG